MIMSSEKSGDEERKLEADTPFEAEDEKEKKKKKKKKLSKVEKLALQAKKRKKKKRSLYDVDDDDDEEPERGLLAWLKYMVGMTGGVLYVNKWLESGGRYEGSWHGASRCPHRYGIMTFVDGETYEGKWRLGIRHGWGAGKFTDGSSYEGDWKNDQFHGKGKYTATNGDTYIGGWVQGLRHGKGVYAWANGNTYEGMWDRGLIHGSGSKTWADGSWYGGRWKYGMRHGKGRFEWPNGNYYKGMWRKGQRNGTGSKRLVDGTRYKGRWLNNRPHGHGIKKWPEAGAMYEGDWENGKHHGYGVKSYADGTRYEGDWYYGKPHGVSILFEGTDRVFKIDFAYGKFVQLLGMWETQEKYRLGIQQEMIEKKAAEALWMKMTLEQLEKDMYEDDFKEFEEAKKREAALALLNDGDIDKSDDVDDLIAMTARGSQISGETPSGMDDDEIRSQVSAASQKLIEMGFSEEAAEAAAKESLARRKQRRDSSLSAHGGDENAIHLPQISGSTKK